MDSFPDAAYPHYHLLPSPTPSDHSHYPFFQHDSHRQAALSLNLSSLAVTSPPNPSSAQALTPVTPISPNAAPFHVHPAAAHHHNIHSQPSAGRPLQLPALHHSHIPSPFQFDPVTSSHQTSQASSPSTGGTPHSHSPGQQQGQGAFDSDRATTSSSSGGGAPLSSSAGSSAPSAVAAAFDHRRSAVTGTSSNSTSTGTPPGPSRSSSASASSSLPRKRSFSTTSSVALVEESMYDVDHRDAVNAATALDLGYPDDIEMRTASSQQQQNDASPSSGSDDHNVRPSANGPAGSTINVLGKPMATNNFVTKLYQMINDPKSQHFISWTELGTSFVVSNVGEFSRSILGAHFKHNNFSSFVRQLNMYGFHKINRTPRAQRTSTDAQTWEFSHHKFLRGRPDLLDEIKRKALEPDPAVKHRVELPGEVAAQLNAMRDENRRVWEQLSSERRRVEKLVGLVTRLWDVVGKNLPGSLPSFPPDLVENDNPNIYITSPATTTSRYPPPLSISHLTGGPIHVHSGNTPNSSPTATDFPSHPHHSHHGHPNLSRQQSIQHISFTRGNGNTGPDSLSSSSTPLQTSPRSMSMDFFDDSGVSTASGHPSPPGRHGVKRQRLSTEDLGPNSMPAPGMNGSNDSLSPLSSVSSPVTTHGSGMGSMGIACAGPGSKRCSRARSESAPLGYHGGFNGLATPWGTNTSSASLIGGGGSGGFAAIPGRPRSGSGLTGIRGVPNIGTMTRGSTSGVLPMLTIPTVPNGSTR